jgi:hypothetical protein
MKEQFIDNLLLNIDGFPKSMEDNSTKFFRSKEEHLNKVLFEELEVVCGASKTECQLLLDKLNGFGLERVVKNLVNGDNLEKSLMEYIDIENKVETEVPSNLFLFAKQSVLSLKALYYYKKKNWNRALVTTLECNALNDYLVQQGVHSLVTRVFEQNKNISSILLRERKFDSAYSLLFNLFNYLLNGTNKGLYGNIFSSNYLWEKMKMVREAYISQMFMVIVADTVRFNLYKKDDFLPSKWYLNLKFKANNTNRKVLSNWIYVNKKLRENNHNEFLISLIDFLNQPISQHYDILKISLIIELNKFIQKNSYSNKTLLLDKLSLYLKEKLTGQVRIREVLIKKLDKQVRVGI